MIGSRPGGYGTCARLPDLEAHQFWDWEHSLATAEAGLRYRVTCAVFSIVRERCHEVGCAEGDELTCIENTTEGVMLATSDERIIFIERMYAWLVRVEPV
jgi:hypothetical protein